MKNRLQYTRLNILRGATIYAIGDTIAALVLNEFSWVRLIGMICVGATLYAFEIPNYFAWIDRRTKELASFKLTLAKTGLAIAYFNPLWIFRHLIFIKLFTGNLEEIDVQLFEIACWSFVANIPISFIANYIIQNKVRLSWRFLASAIFSALMAIYYAMSEVIF